MNRSPIRGIVRGMALASILVASLGAARAAAACERDAAEACCRGTRIAAEERVAGDALMPTSIAAELGEIDALMSTFTSSTFVGAGRVASDAASDEGPCCPDGCNHCSLPCCSGMMILKIATAWVVLVLDDPPVALASLPALPVRGVLTARDLDRPPRA